MPTTASSAQKDARTALDEIVAAGRTRKRQERWVVLGGLMQQGKRNLSYQEIRELAGYHAEKAAFHPGIQMHDHPMFENRSANVGNLSICPCALGS